MLAVIGRIFACPFTGMKGNLFFTIFLTVASVLIFAVLVASGVHVYNNFMDLRDSAAQVREAVLTSKHHTHRFPKTFYAEFEGIGSVIVMGDMYEKLDEGKTYRVI